MDVVRSPGSHRHVQGHTGHCWVGGGLGSTGRKVWQAQHVGISRAGCTGCQHTWSCLNDCAFYWLQKMVDRGQKLC